MTKFASTYRFVLGTQQAGGNRIAKHTYTAVGAYKSSTFYVRDASGNFDSSYSSPERRIRDINPERNESGVMLGSSWLKWNVGLEMPIPWRSITGATYQTVVDALTQTETFKLIERPIYGSSRVGLDVTKVEWIVTTGTTGEQIIEVEPASVPKSYTRELGHKQYELSNHLGNVLVVVNDIKRAVINNNTIEYYTAQVVSATDYSPFGVGLEGRTFSSEEYRYGFQSQEQDSELWEGAVTYKYRVEDPRLGRFFSVDPLCRKYPWNSNYAFSENRLLDCVELEGLEASKVMSGLWNMGMGIVGCVGSAVYIYSTAGAGAALGGGVALTLSIGEVGIGLAQVIDGMRDEPNEDLHRVSTPIGLVAASSGSENAEVIDATVAFIPGMLTGGNIKGSGEAAFNMLDGIDPLRNGSGFLDGVLDTKGLVESVCEEKPKNQTSSDSYKPNIQKCGHITFDSNMARGGRGNLIVTDIETGKDYGVNRNDDGSYRFDCGTPEPTKKS